MGGKVENSPLLASKLGGKGDEGTVFELLSGQRGEGMSAKGVFWKEKSIINKIAFSALTISTLPDGVHRRCYEGGGGVTRLLESGIWTLFNLDGCSRGKDHVAF